MSTTYTGIDYGRGVSNRDPETGIRYGVIAQNSLSPFAVEDVWQNARDFSHENAIANFRLRVQACEDRAALESVLVDYFGKHGYARVKPYLGDGDISDVSMDILEDRFNDNYEDNGERDWLYESDGYKLTNCLQTDVFVLASPYFTYAQFCSPCVPGACNLDSPMVTPPDGVTGGDDFEHDWQKLRDNRAYCLGHDYFDGGRAPYPVYSVATGELVSPAE